MTLASSGNASCNSWSRRRAMPGCSPPTPAPASSSPFHSFVPSTLNSCTTDTHARTHTVTGRTTWRVRIKRRVGVGGRQHVRRAARGTRGTAGTAPPPAGDRTGTRPWRRPSAAGGEAVTSCPCLRRRHPAQHQQGLEQRQRQRPAHTGAPAASRSTRVRRGAVSPVKSPGRPEEGQRRRVQGRHRRTRSRTLRSSTGTMMKSMSRRAKEARCASSRPETQRSTVTPLSRTPYGHAAMTHPPRSWQTAAPLAMCGCRSAGGHRSQRAPS